MTCQSDGTAPNVKSASQMPCVGVYNADIKFFFKNHFDKFDMRFKIDLPINQRCLSCDDIEKKGM
jgi:hypothetical protein